MGRGGEQKWTSTLYMCQALLVLYNIHYTIHDIQKIVHGIIKYKLFFKVLCT